MKNRFPRDAESDFSFIILFDPAVAGDELSGAGLFDKAGESFSEFLRTVSRCFYIRDAYALVRLSKRAVVLPHDGVGFQFFGDILREYERRVYHGKDALSDLRVDHSH